MRHRHRVEFVLDRKRMVVRCVTAGVNSKRRFCFAGAHRSPPSGKSRSLFAVRWRGSGRLSRLAGMVVVAIAPILAVLAAQRVQQPTNKKLHRGWRVLPNVSTPEIVLHLLMAKSVFVPQWGSWKK
jgi:hypothetical protein